jgi:uncharacterized protein involved in exopolysaccharide biosynthesis
MTAPISSTAGFWLRVEALVRRRRIIYLAGLVGLAVGLGSAFIRARRYDATAMFMVQQRNPLGGLQQVAAQYGLGNVRAEAETPEFYADLLTSTELMHDAVVARYAADSGAGFQGTLLEYYGHDELSETNVLRAIRRLRKDVSVGMNRLTGVVTLRVGLTDPGLSEAVGTQFLRLLNDYNVNRRQSQARSERDFLERRVAAAQLELTGAEDTLTDFYRKNRIIGSPELEAVEQRLQRRVQVLQSVYLELAQSYENARVEEVRSTPVINVLQDPGLLVEPRRRHAPRTAVLFGIVIALLSAAVVLVTEEIKLARASGSPEFRHFLAAAEQAVPRRARLTE